MSPVADIGFGDSAFVDPASGIDPFSVQNGALEITAVRAGSDIVGPGKWASGLISTQYSFAQQYGYFEMRAMLPADTGVWPAFWTLPTNGAWPPELDIFEAYGDSSLWQTVHTGIYGGDSYQQTWSYQPTMTTGYHTYGVMWDAQHITFYFDGNVTGQQATPPDMHTPMYLLADLAMQDLAGVTDDPKHLYIDYIRAYSNDPNAIAVPQQPVSPPDGGTDTPCYCAGTLIATTRGDVAVEELVIGDEVLTLGGEPRTIKWIGRRSYAGRFARSAHVLPICIKAGALDLSQPRRDLWVSPHHAMYLEGVLIEAIDLINDVSIIQAKHVDRIDYFHIELDRHDVIIAEGALSESFIDDNSRGIFQNAHEFAALYPDIQTAPARYYAPRRAFGAEVEVARRRIARRAGLPYAPPHASRRPRALVVDTQIPERGHDGGSNAILDHIRALRAAGFAVSFRALSDRPFSEFARAHAGEFDLVYLHRAETATRCLKPARQYFDAQLIYSVADLHHLRLKAQSMFDQEHAVQLMQEAQTIALQELTAALEADCVITHSISEREQLEQLDAIARARKVRVVPWTVPVAPARTSFARRSGVAFIGSFTHAPNRDAACWLVDEIMPLVWREAPEVHCLIAGSDLSDDLRRYMTRPGVAVLGRVEQLGDLFERVRLTVAPLRFGAGLKDKVLRSMAAGLPCIGTAEAFSGMPELPADLVRMCRGESASQLAAAIVAMHRQEEANAPCADRGLSYVAQFYNQARIDALVRDAAQPVLARHRARMRQRSNCTVLDFGTPLMSRA
ncbi:MAG: Hint domain-containing protein [Xanthobacteraceae bacterium]|nr:Hint domain-containing protein [Xanthobacteraceae bacterium]